jgi:ribosomal protein S27AE
VNTIIKSSVSKSKSLESKTSDDVPCTDSFETKIYNIQNEDMYCPINVIDAPGLERMNEKKYADDLKNFITHRFDDPIHFIWHFVDKKGVDINIAQIQKELQLKYLLVISKSDILTKKQYSTLSKKLKNSSQDENQTGTVLISSKPETAPSMCPQCYETSIKSDKEKWICGKCQYSKKIKEPWGIEELIKQSVNSEELVIETLLGSWRLLVMERIKTKISSSVDIISKYVQDNQLYISQQVALMTVDLSELWLYDSNEAQKNRSSKK